MRRMRLRDVGGVRAVRDLVVYFAAACVPALVVSAMALVQLHRVSEEQKREASARVVEAVKRESAKTVFSRSGAAADPRALCVGLRETLGRELGDTPPKGVFIWRTKGGVVGEDGVPGEVLAAIGGIDSMSSWGGFSKHVKKPPMAGVRQLASHFVVWARDGRRNGSLCGAVFDVNPTETGIIAVALWPIGTALGVLIAAVFATGAVLLMRAAARARRDDRMKTTFLSNASHELKTPLAAIGLWVDLLLAGRLATDERRSRAYEVIAAENARMVRLVENLLDFSRLEQGRRRYRIETVDVAALAADVVELVRGEFAAHGISLERGDGCLATADADAVKQVFVNLLGNAAKYAADGGPVEVVVRRDGENVLASVRDRGPGLPPEAMERVFERFWRAEESLNFEKGGLGLGLAISRALAADMDGTLSVSARDGGGCDFTLALPAASGDV